MKHVNNHYGRWRIPMCNLQFFAEGGEGGSDPGGEGEGGNPGGAGGNQVSFDDFLNQEGNKAEFDKRVQDAIDTAVTEAQKKWKMLTDDKLSEAEKLAKMNKEERAAYLADKERKEFEAEKAAFEKEKLLVSVKGTLQEKSLPIAFADALVEIGDAEKIKTAIEDLKKTWDAEIAEAIKEKARQTTPREGGQFAGGNDTFDIGEMAREARIIK